MLTEDAAWFTESFGARLHRLPLGRRGRLGEPETIELGGDWVRSGFTANGIARTPDGSGLLVTDGDAPALVGRTLHVVQPTPNRWTSSDRTGRERVTPRTG